MKRPRLTPKVLLAEGKDEQWVLPELLDAAGVAWPSQAPPVWIEETNGIATILSSPVIETELKTSGLRILGIVVDANGDIGARWQSLSARLEMVIPGLPPEPRLEGVVHDRSDGIRVGLWIMPDNLERGMLETLLLRIRAGDGTLYDHARDAVAAARTKGATFLEAHRDKAELHTWLAWQDPPGQQLHAAVRAHALDARSPLAAPFVAWFRRLFDV
ncbi:MAG: DUF3226 domain-containing protein [Rhodoglobus sp.]